MTTVVGPATEDTAPSRIRARTQRLVRLAGAKTPPPPTVTKSALAWVSASIFGLAVWVTFFALVLSALQESRSQNSLYEQFRQQLATQTAPLGAAINPGAPVALVNAPSLGIHDEVVVEGTASGDLAKGPGHRRDTVLPGQAGISVLYGRSLLYGGPFAHIADAKAGDSIQVTTGQGKFVYYVIDVRRVGDRYPTPVPAGGGQLTLATAEGASVGNLWRPQHPIYVDAVMTGKSKPSPGVGVSSVPDSEHAMHGDPSGLFPLALWLPVLVLVAVAGVWASERWGGWQTWLIVTPLVIATLWGATDAAVRLLPNLL